MADISAFLRRPLSKLMIGLALLLEVGGLVILIATGEQVLGVGLMLSGLLVNVAILHRIRAWRTQQADAAGVAPRASGGTRLPPA